jgi:hypothetical protein
LSIQEDSDEIKEHVVNNMIQSGLLPTDIIHNNAPNISIMFPLLLTTIRDTKKRI